MCDAAGSPAGGGIALQGHGLREREQIGPAQLGGRPFARTLRVRRYRCRACGTVAMVVPRGVLRSVRYGAVAIAIALGLWSSARQPGWRVRQQVSALPSLGEEVLHGWRSLRLWAQRGAELWGAIRGSPVAVDARAAALLIVRQLAAHAPVPTGELVRDASIGALFA